MTKPSTEAVSAAMAVARAGGLWLEDRQDMADILAAAYRVDRVVPEPVPEKAAGIETEGSGA